MENNEDPQEVRETTDHDFLKRWVEERGGKPARVKSLREDDRAKKSGGLLRIDFSGDQKNLEPLSWDDFFITFDFNDFVFIYEDCVGDQLSKVFSIVPKVEEKVEQGNAGKTAEEAVEAANEEREEIGEEKLEEAEEELE